MLTTCYLIDPEEKTPARPFVRDCSYAIAAKLNCCTLQNLPIQVPQYHTEAVLRLHLEKYGCQVELDTEIVGLRQFDDRVEATIRKTNQEVTGTKQYRWLVGADGGRSTHHCTPTSPNQ